MYSHKGYGRCYSKSSVSPSQVCPRHRLPASAQTPAGIITGRVADATGLPLPGVTVTLQGSDIDGTVHHGRRGTLPLSRPRAGRLQGDLGAQTASRRTCATHVDRRRRPDGRSAGDDELGASPRTVTVTAASPMVDAKADRHVDQLHRRRAVEHPDLARPVLADALGARRARRPRQRRRQRDRPAVELRLEGHAAAGCGLDAGRRRDHRHDAHRLRADLLQLRQLRRDSRRRPPARRSRSRPAASGLNFVVKRGTNLFHGGVRGYFDNDAMEASNVPGGAAGQGRHARDRRSQRSRSRTTASSSAARSCATRRGSTARTRRRTCSWCAARGASSTDAAQEPEPEGELAGDAEGHGQLPLLQRLQDQGQPQPRHGGHHLRRADRDVPPGQRLHRQPAARAVQDRRRPRHPAEHVPDGEVRLLQHRLPADARRRHGSAGRPRPHAARNRSAPRCRARTCVRR